MASQKWKHALIHIVIKNEKKKNYKYSNYIKTIKYPLEYGFDPIIISFSYNDKRYCEKLHNCSYPLTSMLYNRPRNNDRFIDVYYLKAAAYFEVFSNISCYIKWYEESGNLNYLCYEYEYEFGDKYLNCLTFGVKKVRMIYFIYFDKDGTAEDEKYYFKYDSRAYLPCKIKLSPSTICGDDEKEKINISQDFTYEGRLLVM